MPLILLRSVSDLRAHIARLPPSTDTEVWWTCPACGAKNLGIRFACSSPCAECSDYEHPPAGDTPKTARDLQIENLQDRIARINGEIEALEDEIWDLRYDRDRLEEQVRMLEAAKE